MADHVTAGSPRTDGSDAETLLMEGHRGHENAIDVSSSGFSKVAGRVNYEGDCLWSPKETQH